MRLIENVHYAVVDIGAGKWAAVPDCWLFCFSDADGRLGLARITDPDINREDVKRHFEKIARERKATKRNRESLAIRRKKE